MPSSPITAPDLEQIKTLLTATTIKETGKMIGSDPPLNEHDPQNAATSKSTVKALLPKHLEGGATKNYTPAFNALAADTSASSDSGAEAVKRAKRVYLHNVISMYSAFADLANDDTANSADVLAARRKLVDYTVAHPYYKTVAKTLNIVSVTNAADETTTKKLVDLMMDGRTNSVDSSGDHLANGSGSSTAYQTGSKIDLPTMASAADTHAKFLHSNFNTDCPTSPQNGGECNEDKYKDKCPDKQFCAKKIWVYAGGSALGLALLLLMALLFRGGRR